MMKQLSCESSTEGQTEATSSNTWDNELPTRHRRDTDVTVDMASVQNIVPTTEGLTEINSVEVTNDSPPAELKEGPAHTQQDSEVTSTQGLPQEMSAAEEPIKTSVDILTDESSNKFVESPQLPQNLTSPLKTFDKDLLDENPIQVPLNSISRITSDEGGSAEVSPQSGERRVVVVQSKPLPPSLRGNSPFVEILALNKTEATTEATDMTTQKPVEKESHEVFRESKVIDITLQPEKPENIQVNFPPLAVYKINSDRDPDESSSRAAQGSSGEKYGDEADQNTSSEPSKKEPYQESNDSKFFTRVIAEEATTTTASPLIGTRTTSKPNTDNDFFIVTENPEKIVSSSNKITTTAPDFPIEKKVEETPILAESIDDLNKPSGVAPDQEMADEAEPEVPERPNRGRLLIRPQHHSFYPYFLNRVLG
uniref:Uncharacterized protein n=1 Tax=Graphocephala atropunctata TaxID=36148 RepID=A0A1B6LBP3_9HEMI